MYAWRVVQMGTPQEGCARHRSIPFGGHIFIGSPGMNVLDATVTATRPLFVRHEIALGFHGLCAALDGKVELGVRPEFTRLCHGEAGLPVTIKRIEDVGRQQDRCALTLTAPKIT